MLVLSRPSWGWGSDNIAFRLPLSLVALDSITINEFSRGGISFSNRIVPSPGNVVETSLICPETFLKQGYLFRHQSKRSIDVGVYDVPLLRQYVPCALCGVYVMQAS